ncbi:MAG TPA: AzlC family ABC transporter permease [Catenuloplanes sp.]
METSTGHPGGWRTGLRVGVGLAAGAFLLAVSFGAFAVTHGWPAALTIVMSLLVFSGSAQFALVSAFAGGGALTAVASASLINLRFVPMAAATARHLRGGRWRRAIEGQAVVDGSWAAAQRPGGGVDRAVLIGATLVQWPAWVLGTAIGALTVPSTSVLYASGLDLVFPGFFAVLLVDSLAAGPRLLPVAIAAAAVAGVACRFLPNGVALLLASSAVLLALRGRPDPSASRPPEEAR